MQFERDADKAASNVHKHGIRFEEAKSVFADRQSITISDSSHSNAEDRFVDIGYSDRGHLLVVVYTERNARIRMISCRKATNTEIKLYEQR